MVGRFQNRLKYFQVDGTFLISRQFQKVLLGFNTGFFSFLPSKLRSRTYFHDSKMIQHFSQHTTTEPPHSLLSSAKTRSNNKKKTCQIKASQLFVETQFKSFEEKKYQQKYRGFLFCFPSSLWLKVIGCQKCSSVFGATYGNQTRNDRLTVDLVQSKVLRHAQRYVCAYVYREQSHS